ncbi:hypothetical protein BDV36DRAFT_247226 [Aspergillus pseudocaelatus]|uniref:Uncharacterized protein n=1 Tax=Aspergillus pseudocaelatus TaxID=1825620 RepID=A0ABQ6WYK2_9EURO|nr:hypothetical protein BDV36DRAFT_247226 [Aspergillus pseudocaelatus]
MQGQGKENDESTMGDEHEGGKQTTRKGAAQAELLHILRLFKAEPKMWLQSEPVKPYSVEYWESWGSTESSERVLGRGNIQASIARGEASGRRGYSAPIEDKTD